MTVRLVGIGSDELLVADEDMVAVDDPHQLALGAPDVVLAGEHDRQFVVGGLEAPGVAELVLALLLEEHLVHLHQ